MRMQVYLSATLAVSAAAACAEPRVVTGPPEIVIHGARNPNEVGSTDGGIDGRCVAGDHEPLRHGYA